MGGRATDIDIEAEGILKARERLNRTTADATGQPLERVERALNTAASSSRSSAHSGAF